MSKSIIFLVKSFLGNIYRHLAILIFFWSHWSCYTIFSISNSEYAKLKLISQSEAVDRYHSSPASAIKIAPRKKLSLLYGGKFWLDQINKSLTQFRFGHCYISGACSIKLILHNLRPFCRKLRNFYNLWANLWSKFGRNNKSVIYGSQKFYGIGPRPTRMVQMDRNTFERFAIIYSTSLVPFFYRWHYGKRKTLVEIKKWSLSLKL